MEAHLLKLMEAVGPWSATCLAAQLQLPLDAVLNELGRQVTSGHVRQHGWNQHGLALFWLEEQLEEQLEGEATG